MEEKTLFTRIIEREVPADIVFENDDLIVFRDINPQAPVHVLLVPKDPLAKIADAGLEHREILATLLLAAGNIARQLEVGDNFRLVINNGERAGQSVFHLHMHLLAGRDFSWPPG